MTPAKFAKKERVDIVVRSARAGTVFSHSVGDVVVALSDERDAMAAENARLRDELTTAEGALTLSQEALQVSVDDFNATKAVNAKLVALLEKPHGNTYSTKWDDERRALLAEIKAGT